jgi:hypothetical protein
VSRIEELMWRIVAIECILRNPRWMAHVWFMASVEPSKECK